MGIYENEINPYNGTFDEYTFDGLYKPLVNVEKQKEKKNIIISNPIKKSATASVAKTEEKIEEVKKVVETAKAEIKAEKKPAEESEKKEEDPEVVVEKPKRRGRPPKKVVEEQEKSE